MDTNISRNAYDQIKYKIIHFHYLPGQKVSEKMISESLNLGRTPVREALIRIEREGLIEVIPQSGTYVTIINMASAKNGRFVRECIEPKIMLEAMTKLTQEGLMHLLVNMQHQREAAQAEEPDHFFDLDQDFHHEFYKIANKNDVWNWLQLNNTQLNRFRRLRLKAANLNWRKLVEQHQKILKAVQEQNVDNLDYLIHAHLHLMLEEKDLVTQQFPAYFGIENN